MKLVGPALPGELVDLGDSAWAMNNLKPASTYQKPGSLIIMSAGLLQRRLILLSIPFVD